jgi:hypothetical protein
VAGNSEQFSHSLSIHRPDLLESKGLHDNSTNLENLTLNNIINAKRKEEEKVNTVLTTELEDLISNIEKQEVMIKTYKKKIKEL